MRLSGRLDRTRLTAAMLALWIAVSACSGNVQVDGVAGAGGETPGAGGSAGTSAGAGGSVGTSTASAGSGGGIDALYQEFCAAVSECQGGPFDSAACVASAACDPLFIHHPGGLLFECLSTGSCSKEGCLLDLYSDYQNTPLTPAAQEFQDRCVEALEAGCGVFEDFCLAGALFTDQALETMTQCYDLPTCAEVVPCALSTYAPCTGWVYQIDP